MGPVSIGVEVQRNTDGDTPSRELYARLVSNLFSCILSVCNIYLFPVLVLREDLPFDCSSSCSLLFYYFYP